VLLSYYYYCYEEEEGADLLKLLMPLMPMPKRNAELLMTKNDQCMKKSILMKTERIPELIPENHKNKTERADDNN